MAKVSTPLRTEQQSAVATGMPSPWKSALADFRADVVRYVYYDDPSAKPTVARVLRAFAAHQGLQAVGLYRLGRYLRAERHRRGLTALMFIIGRITYSILSRLNDIANGIFISTAAEIGPGLFIAHYGGVIIGPSKIGANCNIGNNVTIGRSGRDEHDTPVIGDRVFVAVGARVLGRITVGEDAVVGANSVVVRDVPPRTVAGGIPARTISSEGSFNFVKYPGMEQDEHRTRSLAARS